MTTIAYAGRIRGSAVPALCPADHARVHTVLVGEAPGPRGADQSGVPFLGDRAGRPLYSALTRAGAITWRVPPAEIAWDGRALVAAGALPDAVDIWLTNAFDRCPTDDGAHFRAPTTRERFSAVNLGRLRAELDAAVQRGAVQILCLGKVAASVVEALEYPLRREVLPHPSAQGLLTAAPNRGKGAALRDLEQAWEERLVSHLLAARR
jgi:uracil-DNA glycosylase